MTVTPPAVDVDVDTTGDAVQGRFFLKVPTVTLPTFSVDEVRKPALAFAGLADLAIEQVKEAPAVVRTIPAQVKDLRDEVEARVAQAQETATELYAQLAVRGERLVTSIRRAPATEAAVAEGKEAVKKAEQSATAARKSVKAGEKAVQDAAKKLG